ncbi:tetratricopeptide repeat protein [Vicingus serpentipes]|uniref:Tetratricopeptide repeat protein n=1 Tax=Vicingus serpentipes TaxID=1926625 RepID=A0A5C6RVJ2_9FLAO|nr:tetratricopeptide repeat protein [Vicingus serpentipes]TXB66064.1 tetratricopeptide repeat protein [Vicingus serpentipes]
MKNIFFILSLSILIYSCKNDTQPKEVVLEKQEIVEDPIDTYDERVEDIAKYTVLMYDDSLNFNKEVAENLLLAYDRFITKDDFYNIHKEYIFKAGELCRGLNRPHDAIRYFNMLLEKDPEYKLAPEALFYKAATVGDMLKEHDEAKRLYQEFIDTYPNHPLVESAKGSILIEGQDLKDVIKNFKKKNEADA